MIPPWNLSTASMALFEQSSVVKASPDPPFPFPFASPSQVESFAPDSSGGPSTADFLKSERMVPGAKETKLILDLLGLERD